VMAKLLDNDRSAARPYVLVNGAMFYLGHMQLTWLSGMARLPDIS
jgi:hypothetical protein